MGVYSHHLDIPLLLLQDKCAGWGTLHGAWGLEPACWVNVVHGLRWITLQPVRVTVTTLDREK